MRIQGRLEHNVGAPSSPYITAVVELPNGKSAPINFLVDTGADFTTIHTADSIKLGIGVLPTGVPGNKISVGIGGFAEYKRQDAKLTFKSSKQVYEWEEKIAIGPCGEDRFSAALAGVLRGNSTPSILGRDFLSRGRLVIDDAADEVFLEPHSDEKLRRAKRSHR